MVKQPHIRVAPILDRIRTTLIPTSYVRYTMGRQKTLWIDEDCWAKLEQMEGDSISAKVRKCIEEHDVADGARVDALRAQIKRLEEAISKQPRRMNSA